MSPPFTATLASAPDVPLESLPATSKVKIPSFCIRVLPSESASSSATPGTEPHTTGSLDKAWLLVRLAVCAITLTLGHTLLVCAYFRFVAIVCCLQKCNYYGPAGFRATGSNPQERTSDQLRGLQALATTRCNASYPLPRSSGHCAHGH